MLSTIYSATSLFYPKSKNTTIDGNGNLYFWGGTDSAIYKSTNSGSTWSVERTYASTLVHSINNDTYGNVVVLHDGGVDKFDISTGTWSTDSTLASVIASVSSTRYSSIAYNKNGDQYVLVASSTTQTLYKNGAIETSFTIPSSLNLSHSLTFDSTGNCHALVFSTTGIYHCVYNGAWGSVTTIVTGDYTTKSPVAWNTQRTELAIAYQLQTTPYTTYIKKWTSSGWGTAYSTYAYSDNRDVEQLFYNSSDVLYIISLNRSNYTDLVIKPDGSGTSGESLFVTGLNSTAGDTGSFFSTDSARYPVSAGLTLYDGSTSTSSIKWASNSSYQTTADSPLKEYTLKYSIVAEITKEYTIKYNVTSEFAESEYIVKYNVDSLVRESEYILIYDLNTNSVDREYIFKYPVHVSVETEVIILYSVENTIGDWIIRTKL